MSYRPITDTWILARPKVPYYGAYPNGFLERARVLLGVDLSQPVLHVCGGMVKDYPGKRGIGFNDCTLDMDPLLFPDYLRDARDPIPDPDKWAAVLGDPPYTPEDADHYAVGRSVLPSACEILTSALKGVRPGVRVGILHYIWAAPRPRDLGNPLALITVIAGYDNRARLFSVWERPLR